MTELDKSHNWRHDGRLLFLLLALVVPLRAWMVWNTEVTARDSIGFISYALDIEQKPWKEALLKNHQHPGYPLSIWAMSLPVRQYLGFSSTTMQLSAQLASSLAAVLLIFPMFYLGKIFFERRVAFWGTLLLQFMPVTGQHLSDGISEALFLLLTSLAFLFGALALRRPTIWRFLLCGVFCGMAYLTRPEGALVVLAMLLVLGVRQLVPFWRLQWSTAFRGGLVMTLASLAVGSAYFGFTHCFTNKPSWTQMSSMPDSSIDRFASAGSGERETMNRTADGQGVLFASLFAANLPREGQPLERFGQGLLVYASEGFQLFHYTGFVTLILGLFTRLRRLLRCPEFLLPCAFFLLHTGLIMRLAMKAGYISDRHLLTVAIWGAYFAAAGLCDVPERLMAWFAPLLQKRTPLVTRLALLAFLATCLPRSLQPLHGGQAGNRLVGLWLAGQIKPGDVIHDDHNWSQFYSGALFKEAKSAPPTTSQHTSYHVITRSKDVKVMEEQRREEEKLRAAHGEIVFHWPEKAAIDQSRIVLYAVPSGPASRAP